jgi:hypothetical protein
MTCDVPMARVMAQVGAELRVLGQTLGAVEHAVALVVAASPTADPRALHGLQTIDLLGQSLVALAQFAEELAPRIPSSWEIDVEQAVRGVTLAALAERLRLASTSAALDLAPAAPEFFE